MKSQNFYFDVGLLRIPAFPMTRFFEVVKKFRLTNDELLRICRDEQFQEALKYASTVLSNRLFYFLSGSLVDPDDLASFRRSIFKYYVRMCVRPTPFGLFAGVTTVPILAGAENVTLSSSDLRKHVVIDSTHLFQEAKAVSADESSRRKLYFRVNPTIYKQATEYRYLEVKVNTLTKKLIYDFTSIDSSIHVDHVLRIAKNFQSFDALVGWLCEAFPEIDQDDAEIFIDELIDSSLLISEVDPYTSGGDFGDFLARKLQERQISFTPHLRKLLSSIDSFRDKNERSKSVEFPEILEAEGEDAETGQLFQADLSHTVTAGGIDSKLVEETRRAITFLMKMSTEYRQERLRHLKTGFDTRYERQRIPLTRIFDPDLGVATNDLKVSSPLIEDLLPIAQNMTPLPASRNVKSRILKIDPHTKTAIDISDLDDGSGSLADSRVPTTFSAMLEVFSQTSAVKAYLTSAGQTSAVNLMARFTPFNDEIRALACRIADYEVAFHGDCLIADIGHIPMNYKAGNVLHRTSIWPKEINVGVNSTYPLADQLHLKDLEVSIDERGQLCLWLAGTQQRVIPRKSSAIVQENCPPVYKFLADIESQGKFISFGLVELDSELEYVPRICYKSILLRPATWIVRHEEVKSFRAEGISPSSPSEKISEWRKRRGLPEMALLIEKDNEMPIYFGSELSLDFLLKTLEKKRSVTLREFLFPEFGSAVQNEKGEAYTNQLVISFRKNGNSENFSAG